MSDNDELAARHLRELLRTDRFATMTAVAVLLIVYFSTDGGPWLLAVVGIVALMALVRQIGLLTVRSGDTAATVWLFAAGSWGVSFGVALIFPPALPLLIITMVVPGVLSAIYQSDSGLRAMTLCLAVATAGLTAIGLWSSGVGLADDIDLTLIRLGVVGFVAGQVVTLVVAVRHANDQFHAAIEAAHLANDQLAESRARLVRSADIERSRIERDLHDGAQQRLVSTLMRLRGQAQAGSRGRSIEPAALAELADQLETAMAELRSLARGIYPSLLQSRGLGEALGNLTRSADMTTTTSIGELGDVPSDVATALYFTASEALQNAAKHGGAAASAHVGVSRQGDQLVLAISDTGPGFDADRPAPDGHGAGLTNMADRVGAINGVLTVESAVGNGCTITAVVPVDNEGRGSPASAQAANIG